MPRLSCCCLWRWFSGKHIRLHNYVWSEIRELNVQTLYQASFLLIRNKNHIESNCSSVSPGTLLSTFLALFSIPKALFKCHSFYFKETNDTYVECEYNKRFNHLGDLSNQTKNRSVYFHQQKWMLNNWEINPIRLLFIPNRTYAHSSHS